MTPILPPPEMLAAVVSDVTETMLGLTFRADVGAPWSHLLWRSAVMPIRGAFPISVALSSDRPGCAQLCARLFQIPLDKVSDDMLSDSLRELLNMTGGQLNAQLQLEQTLGLPRLVPENEPPMPTGRPVVLRAETLELILWVTEGIVSGPRGTDAHHPDRG